MFLLEIAGDSSKNPSISFEILVGIVLATLETAAMNRQHLRMKLRFSVNGDNLDAKKWDAAPEGN